MATPFISRVTLKNYKSIAACQVDLQNLTVLVGQNGSGKSNFLDAIKFVSDALAHSLDHALRERGTISQVRRRSNGHPTHFSIRLDFNLPAGQTGHYSFRIGTNKSSDIEVRDEECQIDDLLESQHHFRIREGIVASSSVPAPAIVKDRLALVNFAGNPHFRPVFDCLSRVEIYNLNPKEISRPQKLDPIDELRSDGSNAASILRNVAEDDRARINSFLSKIIPSVRDVNTRMMGGSYETLEFRQEVDGAKDSWRFDASSMSDGTLRAFGILLATLQRTQRGPLLIGLEEPETAVHPYATRIILEALHLASERRQIIVTSHSPDLLDNPDLSDESILKVENQQGITYIDTIDDAGKDVIRRQLFTPGELLRDDQLRLPESSLKVKNDGQLKMFSLEDSA